MKKTRTILVLLLIVLLLVAIGAGLFLWRRQVAKAEAVRRAEAEQAAEAAQYAAYNPFAQMIDRLSETALTVTENGQQIGTYTLSDLGLAEEAYNAVCAAFTQTEQMLPAEFAKLPYETKLAAKVEVKSPTVTVPPEEADLSQVLADLDAVERTAAQDAYVELSGGRYTIHEEVPGNELRSDVVTQALYEALRDTSITPQALCGASFELTDCDCYVQPEVTAQGANFDFDQLLREDLDRCVLTLDFRGSEETLRAADYVSMDEGGTLHIDEAALAAQVDVWAETYNAPYAPYVLDTYVEGPVEMHFLQVNYALDTAALTEAVQAQLLALEPAQIEAPFLCTKGGQSFSLGDTYVEVDIKNQVMTYFKDGEVFLTTDIVTGSAWLSPTPEGLYKVENMTTDTWLFGEDYTVYVDYWVGFIGFWYGLHDASWRTEFGGDNYLTNGSHGCVNTPTEAMKTIYENIELGVPVIVHGPYRSGS